MCTQSLLATVATRYTRLGGKRRSQMSKRKLPPCSVARCTRTAGAIIAGALYCGQHALERFEERSRRDAR
jgi:hypothetical protein